MSRIKPAENPSAESQAILDGFQEKLGTVPNIFKTMAHSTAILEFYKQGSGALGKTSLSAKLREQIALVVAGANACGYCASAHTAIGKNLGLSEDEATQSLHGKASDSKAQAVLDLARKIVGQRAHLSDQELLEARDAGLSDTEILEVVAVVCFNLFTNYFNHVADTDIDFPEVKLDGVQKAA